MLTSVKVNNNLIENVENIFANTKNKKRNNNTKCNPLPPPYPNPNSNPTPAPAPAPALAGMPNGVCYPPFGRIFPTDNCKVVAS